MPESKKLFISGFLILCFMAMIRVHLPINHTFFKSIYRPIDSFLAFFSLQQTWTMFSPNPSRTNIFLTAEVEFKNGSKDVYHFPRSSSLNIVEKYTHGERYRVISENIRKDDNSFLWKDAAQFALRKLRKENSHQTPVRVHLFRHWNIIPDVKSRFLPHLSSPGKYQQYKFFTYEVL